MSQSQSETESNRDRLFLTVSSGQARNSIHVILPDLPTEPPKHGPVPASPSLTQKMETEHHVWAIITKYRGRQLILSDAADVTKEDHSKTINLLQN